MRHLKHDRREAREQVESARNHRGRVDERRHGRGSGHGIRQPHKEGDLRAFAGGTNKDQQHNESEQPGFDAGSFGKQGAKVERADFAKEEEHRKQEGKVAHPVHDERLVGGSAIAKVGVPEPDQQIRAEPHAFPPEEQHGQIIGQDEVEHGEDEEIQVRKEAPESRIAMHITDRVPVDDTAYAGNDEQHNERELIDAIGKVDRQVARGHPCKVGRDHRIAREGSKEVDRKGKGNGYGSRADRANQALAGAKLRQKERKHPAKQCTCQGKQKNKSYQQFRIHARGRQATSGGYEAKRQMHSAHPLERLRRSVQRVR